MGIIQAIEESHREFVGSLAKGLNVIQACSIVDVGVSPHDLH